MNCKNCGAPLPRSGMCAYCGSISDKPVVKPRRFKNECPVCHGRPQILYTEDAGEMEWRVIVKCKTCGRQSIPYKLNMYDLEFQEKQVDLIIKALHDFGGEENQDVTVIYADDQVMATIPSRPQDEELERYLNDTIRRNWITPNELRRILNLPPFEESVDAFERIREVNRS